MAASSRRRRPHAGGRARDGLAGGRELGQQPRRGSTVEEYVQSIERAQGSPSAPLDGELTAAREYNDALSPRTLLDPWGDAKPRTDAAYQAYLQTLSATEAMGRIRIPDIGIDLLIHHDATNASLANGVGHMYGSSLPVGGVGTHAVLAGHTGLAGHTFFDRLPELTVGDRFYVDVAGRTLTYQVDQIVLVEPWQLEQVQRIDGADHVTLVTCYTVGRGHVQRLLVRGVRVADETTAEPTTQGDAPANIQPAQVPAAADLSVQGWMWPRIATAGTAVAITIAMLLGWAVRDRRAKAGER